MNLVTQQTGLFSQRQMSGYYRYKDIFQILPLNVSLEDQLIDFPLLLEIKYCPDVWPASSETFWYRDVWERDRLERIKNKSQMKRIDYDDDWIKAYQKTTKMKRSVAIYEEISNLLTLFSNHNFFKYSHENKWFLSNNKDDDDWIKASKKTTKMKRSTAIFEKLSNLLTSLSNHIFFKYNGEQKCFLANDKEVDKFTAQWGQVFYNFPSLVGDCNELSDVDGYEKIKKIKVQQYKKKSRESYCYSEDEGANDITFPADLDALFDKYFNLNNDDMGKFYTACKLYNQALELETTHSSLSLVASAMAIEALLNNEVEKYKCGHEKSIEQCENEECKIPIYGLNSRFKQFFLEYAADSPVMEKFAGKFYKFRSGIAHGGLLRDDLHDSGFYAGDNDEEQAFRGESLSITNHLLINWLVKN